MSSVRSRITWSFTDAIVFVTMLNSSSFVMTPSSIASLNVSFRVFSNEFIALFVRTSAEKTPESEFVSFCLSQI